MHLILCLGVCNKRRYTYSNKMSTPSSLRQASADPSHRICIFGPQYCFPTQFQLQMREKFFKLREDCFQIKDTAGTTFFQVN